MKIYKYLWKNGGYVYDGEILIKELFVSFHFPVFIAETRFQIPYNNIGVFVAWRFLSYRKLTNKELNKLMARRGV